MRRVALLLVTLVSFSALGCVVGGAEEPPQAVGTATGEALDQAAGTSTDEMKDAAACTIALSEEALACGTAVVQGGVDVPNDAACAIALANAVHACQ